MSTSPTPAVSHSATLPARKRMSAKERQRKMAAAKYLLLVEGYSLRQTAEALALNPKTICVWVKEQGWREELKKNRAGRPLKRLALDDSLSAFLAFVRIHINELHGDLMPAYQQFINHR